MHDPSKLAVEGLGLYLIRCEADYPELNQDEPGLNDGDSGDAGQVVPVGKVSIATAAKSKPAPSKPHPSDDECVCVSGMEAASKAKRLMLESRIAEIRARCLAFVFGCQIIHGISGFVGVHSDRFGSVLDNPGSRRGDWMEPRGLKMDSWFEICGLIHP